MEQEESSPRMPLMDHIDELRVRVMRCLYIFFIGFALSWFGIKDYVMEFLKQPLYEVVSPAEQHLYFTGLFEKFFAHLKISAISSLFLFAPLYFYQVWKFIEPGLYPRERKFIIPFLAFATLFFVGGAAFAYYLLFPVAFKYFVHFGGGGDVPILTIDAYYTTVLKLILLFGLSFELPVAIVLFGYLGVIDSEMLKRNRQTAIIGIAVACALFAPPDAISMLIMMAPLVVLYEGSIWVVHWIGAKKSLSLTTKQ